MPQPLRERKLYSAVERWLRRQFKCFKTAIDRGLHYGRIDVIGVRDTGRELSSEVETIAIEVKPGRFPFANSCGQTAGYKVYANRVYLADLRSRPFMSDEIQIASHLGIGLIEIRGSRCKEVLSSPFHKPIPELNLRLLEALRLGRCQLCDSIFDIGLPQGTNAFSNVTREKLAKAVELKKGLMFWNYEVAKRKDRLGIRPLKNKPPHSFERRFVCPDCIEVFIKPLVGHDNQ